MNHMAKIMVLSCSLGLLVACGEKKDDLATNSKSKPTISTKQSKKSTISSEQNTQGQLTEVPVTNDLQKIFVGEKLPSIIPYTNAQQISATYTTPHSKSYTISYFATDKRLLLNDTSLANQIPFATFDKEEKATESEAIQAIGNTELDGIPIALNHNIQGYQQGAAGSTYVAWKEGNWSLLVQTTNDSDDDATVVANQIIDLLEKIYLPAPSNAGLIKIHVGASNELSYNQKNIVYKVTHTNYLSLLEMTAGIQ
jgi:hypothetical protein